MTAVPPGRRTWPGPVGRSRMAATLACTLGALLIIAAPAAAATFSNTTALNGALPTCGGPPAQFTPYPSTINVSGLTAPRRMST